VAEVDPPVARLLDERGRDALAAQRDADRFAHLGAAQHTSSRYATTVTVTSSR